MGGGTHRDVLRTLLVVFQYSCSGADGYELYFWIRAITIPVYVPSESIEAERNDAPHPIPLESGNCLEFRGYDHLLDSSLGLRFGSGSVSRHSARCHDLRRSGSGLFELRFHPARVARQDFALEAATTSSRVGRALGKSDAAKAAKAPLGSSGRQ